MNSDSEIYSINELASLLVNDRGGKTGWKGVVIANGITQDEFRAFPRNRQGLIDKRGTEAIVFARGSADITMATPTNSNGNLVDEFEESFQVEFYIVPHRH